MRAVPRFAAALAMIAAVALAVVMLNSGPAYTQTTSKSNPVTIVGPLPVPVSATSPLPVNGTVSLSSGSAVTVANAAGAPVLVRDVDEFAKVPFQAGATLNTNLGPSVVVTTVPSDKRLIIEHVSVYGQVGSTEGIDVAVIFTPGSADDTLPCAPTGSPAGTNFQYFACSALTKYYAGPNSNVTFAAHAVNSAPSQFDVFISGYYMPVQ